MLLKSINYQSDDRRHALDHVQQVFTECFDHVDNLEALVICLSNMIQKALWGWIRQRKQCNHQIQCHLYWSPSTFQLLWLVAKLPEHSDGSVPRLARLLNDRSRSQVASMKPWTTGKHITSFYQSQSFALSELQHKRPLAQNTSSCASTSARQSWIVLREGNGRMRKYRK